MTKVVVEPETILPPKRQVVDFIKPGTSLLKSSLSPLKRKVEPEVELSISLVSAAKPVESFSGRVRQGKESVEETKISASEPKLSIAEPKVSVTNVEPESPEGTVISGTLRSIELKESPPKQTKRGRPRKTSTAPEPAFGPQDSTAKSDEPEMAKTDESTADELQKELKSNLSDQEAQVRQ